MDEAKPMTREEKNAYDLGKSHTNCHDSCRGITMFNIETAMSIRKAYMNGRIDGEIARTALQRSPTDAQQTSGEDRS